MNLHIKLIVMRILAVIICAQLYLSLTACDSNKEHSGNAPTEITLFNYEVQAKTFSDQTKQNDIELRYPFFLKTTLECGNFNQLIQDELRYYFTTFYGENTSGLKLEADYEIMYASDEFVSIVFHGISSRKQNAHPLRFAFSMNIVMDTLEVLRTADILEKEADLAKRFLMQLKSEDDVIQAYFRQSTMESIEAMFRLENTFIYYTMDGIGVLCGVSHAIGDYIDVLMPRKQGDTGTVCPH